MEYAIFKQNFWYDPEGLNIENPKNIVFKGTLPECAKELRLMKEGFEYNYPHHDGGMYADLRPDGRRDPDTGSIEYYPYPYLEIYWMYAKSKDVYKIRELK